MKSSAMLGFSLFYGIMIWVKMLEHGKMEHGIFEIVDTESLVPVEYLLRKIDAAMDFRKICDMVKPLYCADNGRLSVYSVILFKMVLIRQLYALDLCTGRRRKYL